MLVGCWFIFDLLIISYIFAEVHRDYPGQQRRRTMESSLAYSIADVCMRSGIGRTAIYDMINTGKLIARKRGRRTLILADDLQRCLELLPPIKIKADRAREKRS